MSTEFVKLVGMDTNKVINVSFTGSWFENYILFFKWAGRIDFAQKDRKSAR